MNQKEPTFFNDLMEGLQDGIDWARGKRTLRTTRLSIPDSPPSYSPAEIRTIRDRIGMSQALFARYLGVSLKTLQGWEQGLRSPSRPTARLIQVIGANPDVVPVSGTPEVGRSRP